jgi:hypothetical protein
MSSIGDDGYISGSELTQASLIRCKPIGTAQKKHQQEHTGPQSELFREEMNDKQTDFYLHIN